MHGAIAGWYGEVGVVWPGSKMLEKHYQGQREGLEKELGTPVFTAAVAASMMAAKGCQVLMGKYQSEQSTIHFFDLLEDDWENIRLLLLLQYTGKTSSRKCCQYFLKLLPVLIRRRQ